MINKIKGEMAVMKSLDIKPNYAALARKYGLDWRTVKKYCNGYNGKPSQRKRSSKLEPFKQEITDKLSINRITVQGVYQFMVRKYGMSRIGTYSNFNKYVKKSNLKLKKKSDGHPRFETEPGIQAQVDWKENIHLTSKYGEVFTVNVLHVVLKFSRFSHLELTTQRRFEDVAKGLINAFRHFGGTPNELLFDNMSTVSNVNSRKRQPTESIAKMSKDFGFAVHLCKPRSAQTKGTVESRNKVIDWLRAYDGEFETYEDLIQIVEAINNNMNININQETQMSPTALLYKEKEYLHSLPPQDVIDTYLRPNKYRVSDEALIRYGDSKYSVDPKLIEKEVSVDILDDKLFIYYNGKLSTIHPLNKKPVNYNESHYRSLMAGKVKDENLNSVVTKNLELMDRLLEIRNVTVSEVAATKSTEALITYINQSEYGRWVINTFSNLSANDKLTFIRGMNEVLPYVKNRDFFISRIKYSLKDNMCRNIDFDCMVNDLMAFSEAETILTDEGFDVIKSKYSKELDELLNQMGENNIKAEIEYMSAQKAIDFDGSNPDDDLPF